MGLKTFFHKIKMGFVRMGQNSLPYVNELKRYGNKGEEAFVSYLADLLPECRIKNNVLVNTPDKNAEIDCLVLYKNKLFAIEIKRWKGFLIETENGFIQQKTDRWTGEEHDKILKSPFRQLNRALYLLRKQISGKVWINAIVFFADDEFGGIETNAENLWFCDINKLAKYITEGGKTSNISEAESFFDRCVAADLLYSASWDKSLRCIIYDDSLQFNIPNGIITRSQIINIQIRHFWSYDRLTIALKNNSVCCVDIENGEIKIDDNGTVKKYGLSKLDYIELGK